jgi:hypothetical protein
MIAMTDICLYCGKELPYSALRCPNSFANRKRMHRKCARLAAIKLARIDYARRKAINKKREDAKK